MGEVYRARDTRLDRSVAIKILPAHLSSDPIRKQRFEREARAISGLNHPHICVLHDVGNEDGIDYLVMECVEGETLAKRLEKGPLPFDQVLKYGAQIANALDRAHRCGVIHRDLKPSNIMLTPAGAKLLDFGLAKPVSPLATLATVTAAMTQSSPVTEQGSIVGTFQYMSPEQVEGKELDGRSDIFSLGAVLYEMLTGERAYPGRSQLSVASAILEKEPAPISTLKPMIPPGLEHAIQRCLAKDPEERWQAARDLALELKWTSESGSRALVSPTQGLRRRKERPLWILAVSVLALAIAVIANAVVWWRHQTPASQTTHFYAPVSLAGRDIILAPNGRTAAVGAYSQSARKDVIWIYEVGSQGARSLPGTEGADYPFWSSDGKSIAFFADGRLKKLELASGLVRGICDAPAGAWRHLEQRRCDPIFAPRAAKRTLSRSSVWRHTATSNSN
jgi:serine/threonine protein kinase